jgi:hypothetical protein
LSAELRIQRDALAAKVETLRKQKSDMPEDVYYSELESLLVEMSRLYASAEGPATPPDAVMP